MSAQEQETTPRSSYIKELEAEIREQAARIRVLETTAQSRYINRLLAKLDDKEARYWLKLEKMKKSRKRDQT